MLDRIARFARLSVLISSCFNAVRLTRSVSSLRRVFWRMSPAIALRPRRCARSRRLLQIFSAFETASSDFFLPAFARLLEAQIHLRQRAIPLSGVACVASQFGAQAVELDLIVVPRDDSACYAAASTRLPESLGRLARLLRMSSAKETWKATRPAPRSGRVAWQKNPQKP